MLCGKSDNFWLEQAVSQNDPIYTLLCYKRINLSMKQLFEIASQKLPDDIDTCLFYLLYLNIKNANQVNWKEFGIHILLETKTSGSLAMFCFYLYGKMQIDEWNYIAEQLSEWNQFERLAYLLVYLYYIQQINFRASQNNFIYFLTKILLSNDTTIPLDD
ncbi:unnamed protein product, partial [Didymodactylos carnosus]